MILHLHTRISKNIYFKQRQNEAVTNEFLAVLYFQHSVSVSPFYSEIQLAVSRTERKPATTDGN